MKGIKSQFDIQRVAYAAAVVAFFGFLFVISTTEIDSAADIDVWFHLSQGRYMVENHTVPMHDVFSWTATDRPDVNQEWGGEVLMYLTYRQFGIGGIVALKATLIISTFAMLLWTAIRLLGRSYLALVLLGLVTLGSSFRFLPRPEVFTYFLFSVLLFLLFSFKYRWRKTLPWLVPLFLLWANLHGGFILGLIVLWVFTFGESIAVSLKRFFDWHLPIALVGRDLRKLWTFAVLATLVTAINPFGLRLIPETVQTIGIVKFANIAEWLPLAFSQARYELLAVAFFTLAVLGALSFLFNSRFFDLTNLLLFAALFFSALTAVRNVISFALGTFLVVFMNWKLYLRDYTPIHSRAFRAISAAAGAVLTFAFATGMVVIVIEGDIITRTQARFGFGEARNPFAGGVEFLAHNGLTERLYNEYYLGSYLIWRLYPSRSVFVDGRTYLYDREYLAQSGAVFREPDGLSRLTRQYDLNAVIVLNGRLPLELLGKSETEDWQLVYVDDAVSVFLRKRSENADLLRRFGYTAYRPNLTLQELQPTVPNRNVLIREAKRSLAVTSNQTDAHFVLGLIAEYAHENERARDEYLTATFIRPKASTLYRQLGSVYRSLGRDAEAEAAEATYAKFAPPSNDIYGRPLP